MAENTFTYTNYTIASDGKTVSFNYRIQRDNQTYNLTEALSFPISWEDNALVAPALRTLHLALGVSYYKIFLLPTIEHPYAMDETEAEFWNDVFQNGLGEFLYVNKLDKGKVATFRAQAGQQFTNSAATLHDGALLGIGGGKDSIIAGELLKAIGLPLGSFVMATGEQLGQAKAVADTMGIPMNTVARTLDKQLLDLQEQPGAYKGHIPISLVFALVGVVVALTQKMKYVIVANEASASTPTIVRDGASVNHQWSKSFGFEKKIQDYIKKYISPELTYFSAIRPFTSIAVAKRFVKYPQYFETFTSDNFVFRIDPAKRPNGRWSLESPKSLSSFILLAPWLSDNDIQRIFGRNYLDKPELTALFLSLTGKQGEPPLDCVGTVDELILSINLLAKAGRFTDAYLMKLAHQHNLIEDKDWDNVLQEMLKLQPDQAFPNELANRLLQELRA